MRTNRRWAVSVAAFLGLGLACSSGCQTVMGGMTLPSGRYLDGHYPQYFAPDPAFPLPRELNSMQDPEGAARRQGGLGAAPVAPAAPVPVPAPGAPAAPLGAP